MLTNVKVLADSARRFEMPQGLRISFNRRRPRRDRPRCGMLVIASIEGRFNSFRKLHFWAAIRAGYSAKTAKSIEQRLLTNVDIQAAIQTAVVPGNRLMVNDGIQSAIQERREAPNHREKPYKTLHRGTRPNARHGSETTRKNQYFRTHPRASRGPETTCKNLCSR
jgi:hypothetical protein